MEIKANQKCGLRHLPTLVNEITRRIFHRRHLAFASAIWLLAGPNLFADDTNRFVPSWEPGYVKTNPPYVTIGNLMVLTNSPHDTDEFKQFKWRQELMERELRAAGTNGLEKFVASSWQLAKDYPQHPNGYQSLMGAAGDYEFLGQPDKARELAEQLAASPASENIRQWAKGFVHRLAAMHQPIDLKFTAVDGRSVDLAQWRGKVVLVDFWATTCGPCRQELPRVKAAYDQFHAQGLEVVGISCDTDKDLLLRFLKEKDLPWPQFFDGKQQTDNQFSQAFGVDGIPHMFLVGKDGRLAFDNVRANDRVHPIGDTLSFEEKISQLLAQPWHAE
jgi:peroxiredoxin